MSSSSNDPVSEFLAREQSALAELGDDFVAAAPPSQTDNDGILLTNGGSDFGSIANLDAFDVNEGKVAINGISGSLRGSPSFSHSRSQSQQLEEEPEKIRKWREEQKEKIAEKDKIEEQKKEELREQAKKELEQFYAQRKSQLEERKKLNREREVTLKEEQSPNSHQDTAAMVWERVARMIEGGAGGTIGAPIGGGVAKGAKSSAQSVASGGGSSGGKDTTRMKQLIIAYARGDQQQQVGGEKSPDKETTVKMES